MVREALTPDERRGGIAYLDQRIVPAGEAIRVDREEVRIDAPSVIGFVDRRPMANWGHDCRYLLIDSATGSVRSIDAQFPPFLRGAAPTLRLVWKGDAAPDWAPAVTERVGG